MSANWRPFCVSVWPLVEVNVVVVQVSNNYLVTKQTNKQQQVEIVVCWPSV